MPYRSPEPTHKFWRSTPMKERSDRQKSKESRARLTVRLHSFYEALKAQTAADAEEFFKHVETQARAGADRLSHQST